jgi:hypothetical protein
MRDTEQVFKCEMLVARMISANVEEYKRLNLQPRYYEVEYQTSGLSSSFRCELLEKCSLPAEVLVLEIWKDYLFFKCAKTFLGPSNDQQVSIYEKNKMELNKSYKMKILITNGNIKIAESSGFSFLKKTYQMYDFFKVTQNLFHMFPNRFIDGKKDEHFTKCFLALQKSMKSFYLDRLYEPDVDRFLYKFLMENEELYREYSNNIVDR